MELYYKGHKYLFEDDENGGSNTTDETSEAEKNNTNVNDSSTNNLLSQPEIKLPSPKIINFENTFLNAIDIADASDNTTETIFSITKKKWEGKEDEENKSLEQPLIDTSNLMTRNDLSSALEQSHDAINKVQADIDRMKQLLSKNKGVTVNVNYSQPKTIRTHKNKKGDNVDLVKEPPVQN